MFIDVKFLSEIEKWYYCASETKFDVSFEVPIGRAVVGDIGLSVPRNQC